MYVKIPASLLVLLAVLLLGMSFLVIWALDTGRDAEQIVETTTPTPTDMAADFRPPEQVVDPEPLIDHASDDALDNIEAQQEAKTSAQQAEQQRQDIRANGVGLALLNAQKTEKIKDYLKKIKANQMGFSQVERQMWIAVYEDLVKASQLEFICRTQNDKKACQDLRNMATNSKLSEHQGKWAVESS